MSWQGVMLRLPLVKCAAIMVVGMFFLVACRPPGESITMDPIESSSPEVTVEQGQAPTPIPGTISGVTTRSNPIPRIGSQLDMPDVVSVVEDVRGAVVSVVAAVQQVGGFGGNRSFQSGSGVIFDKQGHILTNNHVISGASNVLITLDDGRQLDAAIVGTDPLTDLAVLRVEDGSLTHVSFADPASVRVGEWVIAIGNALALPGGPSVTLGIVSALDRSFKIDQSVTLYDLIQTDTIINPGNSGGPLLNLSGEVVGINTAALRSGSVEGIGFAIGGETAIHVSTELIESGRVEWPWMGIIVAELDAKQASLIGIPTNHGILIQEVLAGSPADGGGLKKGDVLMSMGGGRTSQIKELTLLLRFKLGVGQVVNVEVWRDESIHILEMTLGERPAA